MCTNKILLAALVVVTYAYITSIEAHIPKESVNANNIQNNDYQVMVPSPVNQFADLSNWIIEHEIDLKKEGLNIKHLGDACYILDIDNDGNNEYVFVSYKNPFYENDNRIFSELNDYYHLYIFSKEKSGYKYTKTYSNIDDWKKITPAQSGYEHRPAFEFINPIAKQSEIFVRVKNKIYIVAAEYMDLRRPHRTIYSCKKTKHKLKINGKYCHRYCFKAICDNYWTKQQRSMFQWLYDKGLYGQAYNFGQGINSKNLELDLWIRNDLALTVLKDEHPKLAQAIINSLKNKKQFSQSKSSLKNAVEFNQKLINDSIAKYESGSLNVMSDYSWLLDSQGLINNGKIDLLFSSIIPDLPYEKEKWNNREIYYSWKEKLFDLCNDLYVDSVSDDKRYIILRGNHGIIFIWIDLKTNNCALVRPWGHNDNEILIFSRSIRHSDLPKDLCDRIKLWLEKENRWWRPRSIYFYGLNGRIEINISKFANH